MAIDYLEILRKKFVGYELASLDNKGRFSFPSAFRQKLLLRNNTSDLTLIPLHADIEKEAEKIWVYDPIRMSHIGVDFGKLEELTIDSQGRMVLPKYLANHLGLPPYSQNVEGTPGSQRKDLEIRASPNGDFLIFSI